MFKKKKNKKKKEDAGASVSEFGMDFSDEEDEGAGAPVAAIVQENVTFSGYLSYSGIKRGAPLRKGTPKETSRRWVVVASTGEVSTFASEEEYPEKVIKTFSLEGASVNINVKKKGLHRSFLSLPAIDGGACLYFGPAPAQAKVMSAEEKAKAMEKLAGGGGGPAWLSDPSFPSMDEMGRAKSHKDYGKGDADLEKRVKAAKKAAASAPEPEPEDSSSDEEEEKIGWADMVGFVWALAALNPPIKVGTGGAADDTNPLLADDSNPLLNGSDSDDDDDDEEFVEQEVKYTHHAPEPESPDSSDSSDDEEPEDPGPQVRLKQTDKGACVSKFGPKAAKCKGMRSGVLLAQINGKDTRLWTVDMCMSAFKTEPRPMNLVFVTQPDEDSEDDSD